jgi:hypothetical protein
MYWLTDRTPHESLPLKNASHRQYFRLVTSRLSAWFPQHSTSTRLGVLPDPAVTKVLDMDKFATLPAPPQEQLWRITRVAGVRPGVISREEDARAFYSGEAVLPYGSFVRGARDGTKVRLSDGSGEVRWSHLAACDGVELTIRLEDASELEAWESKWACAAADAGLDFSEYACDVEGLISFVNGDLTSIYSWDYRENTWKLNVVKIQYPAIIAAVFSKESRWAGSTATCPLSWKQTSESLPTSDSD